MRWLSTKSEQSVGSWPAAFICFMPLVKSLSAVTLSYSGCAEAAPETPTAAVTAAIASHLWRAPSPPPPLHARVVIEAMRIPLQVSEVHPLSQLSRPAQQTDRAWAPVVLPRAGP